MNNHQKKNTHNVGILVTKRESIVVDSLPKGIIDTKRVFVFQKYIKFRKKKCDFFFILG